MSERNMLRRITKIGLKIKKLGGSEQGCKLPGVDGPWSTAVWCQSAGEGPLQYPGPARSSGNARAA